MAVRSNRRANNERESRGTSPMITASKHISLSFIIQNERRGRRIQMKNKKKKENERGQKMIQTAANH